MSSINAAELAEAIFPWRVDLRERTGSTNSDAIAAARDQADEGLVIIADEQTAGRGRLDRRWEAPPGSSLMFSVLLRPKVDMSRWGWLPLLAGVALVEALPTGTRRMGLK